ncbi:extracellular solute-binding protein [Algicola sagamiensis]|uniref:extracellular solute-binding protein n=1 Tax=Algicola sagamiensis TaxID=163869 RepID=UPI000381B729|nr:extracellular solute-binding protein [Algicola sagamiensis]
MLQKSFKKTTLALSLSMMAFSAVLQAADDQLILWHSYRGAEKSSLEKVVQQYNQDMAGKGVKIKPLAVPHDAYADKITAAVPRGKGPDVFIFSQDRLGGWIESGIIQSIDFFIEDETLENVDEKLVSALTYQDTIYGIPLNFKSTALIYNKKLIKTPPKTDKELITLAKKHTNKAAGQFGLAYKYNKFYFHVPIMNAFGGRVFDEKSNPVLNSKENKASLSYMMDWYENGQFLPEEPSDALITSLFNKSKAAMVISGPWFLGEVKDDIDVGIAPLPTITKTGKPMEPWLSVEGAYISTKSKYQEKAFNFIQYLTTKDVGLTMALEGGQLPANRTVYEDIRVLNNPILKGFYDQMKTATPMPNRAEMTIVWSHTPTALNKIVKKTTTIDKAMDQAQQFALKDIQVLRKSQ